MTKRIAYLHVGTHKTGTSSIQAFIGMNEPALASSGIFVPRAGRATRWRSTNVGHHNLAWELNAMDSFAPEEGTFAQTIDEIARANLPTVVLSSEEFGWLHEKPAVLSDIRDRLHAIGYATSVIIYLRAQPEYIQALYTENAKVGVLFNYGAVFSSIIEHGYWRNTPLSIAVEYSRFVDGFARVFGTDRTIVRPYYSGRRPAALLREFLALVGGSEIPYRALLQPMHLNQSPTLLRVLNGLYSAVAAHDANAIDPQSLASTCLTPSDLPILERKFDVMSEQERIAVFRRFAPDNREVARKYGAGPPFQVDTDLGQYDDATRDAVEKQRLVLDAALHAWNITAGPK